MKYKIKHVSTVVFASLFAIYLNAQVRSIPDSINRADVEENILYGSQKYGRFVGNMSVVNGDDLSAYPALMINEILEGQLPGLFIRQNTGTPGTDDFNVSIRGNLGGYVVLVDGVDRALTQYDIGQIAEVRVLKDAVSKALYGGKMCNGIIMVTTKRGKNIKNQFHIDIEQGVKTPTYLPKYLDSYDFATKYNEALTNDGITIGKYTQDQLNGYKNHLNQYKYPDVDYYGEFLNQFMNITKTSAEYYGGTEKTKYYVHGSYQNEGGLEKYGTKKTGINTIILQGNLDTQFSDKILLNTNFGSYIAEKMYPYGFNFSTLSSRYPNAYPIFTKGDSLGGTNTWTDNPYGGQAKSGYIQENHLRVRGDIGLVFKLDDLIEGLSLKPRYSFDTYHKQNLTKINRPAIYSINSFDSIGNPLSLNTIQTEQLATSQSFGDDDYLNSWMFNTELSYVKNFAHSSISSDLVYYISNTSTAGNQYDYKIQNLGLRINYMLFDRYTIEGVLNNVGSQSYTVNNRYKFFPALGVGWLLSNEQSIKDTHVFDFLKLNASWGIMGDANITPNLWRQTWNATGNYYFNTSVYAQTTQLSQVENLLLNWPVQQEIDLSIEANMMKCLYTKLSYFDYIQSGLLSKEINSIPSIIGGSSFLTYMNYEKSQMNGFEFELGYKRQLGSFRIKVGGQLTVSETKKMVVDELSDPNFTTVGTPVNAIWGYRFAGYYKQDEIDQLNAGTSVLPKPSYIDSKSLKAGNLKYADINNDGIIDKYDTQVIGNSSPNMMFGGNINVGYKGFDLSILLLGYGKYNMLLNSPYYQNYSTRKYSNVLNTGLPNGNPHPLLTTGDGLNDFQVSDYWIVDGTFLKVKNVALSYSFPKNVISPLNMKDLKLSIYGTNLLCFSKIKDLDLESLSAGVSNFPLFSTYALGVTITF